jgi:hypothetical protein
LSQSGFRILQASDGDEAIAIFEKHADGIDFAILDVIMPRQGGVAVYQAIRRTRLDLPVLFTSGYTSNNFDDGQLPPDASLLTKPYSPSVLLNKIHEMLTEQGVI